MERTRAGTGPDAIRHVGCARLSGETVEKTPNWPKRRRDLDLQIHPTRDVSHGFFTFFGGVSDRRGEECAWARKGSRSKGATQFHSSKPQHPVDKKKRQIQSSSPSVSTPAASTCLPLRLSSRMLTHGNPTGIANDQTTWNQGAYRLSLFLSRIARVPPPRTKVEKRDITKTPEASRTRKDTGRAERGEKSAGYVTSRCCVPGTFSSMSGAVELVYRYTYEPTAISQLSSRGR